LATTYDGWGEAWGSPSAWGTSWVVTVSDEPIGGHFAWPEKKKKKELIKKVHEEAEQLESAPVEIQKQAEKISKKYPYRITKRNLVKIDTEALQNDLSRLQFLMQAWEEQKIIMQEEEDIIELVTRGLI
jgi:L-lysine 2,3-aminomutase